MNIISDVSLGHKYHYENDNNKNVSLNIIFDFSV